MKRILLSIILALILVPVSASEIEDDYLDIAGDYCVVGDYNSAMEYINKILIINPSNQKAIDLKKGLNHVIANDKKSFIENVSPSVKQAMEYARTGDENGEYQSLLRATKEQNSYLAYYYLGNFYRRKNDFTRALDAFNSSSSARTDFAPAYLSSAIILEEMGKYESAINSIDKYLTFNPNDDLAYAIKSRAEFSIGEIMKSKADNQRAININDCTEYQFDRAKILYIEGDYQNSKNLFSSLLKDIQTSKIYEYMGLCDYALKNYSSALSNFDKAILLSNDDEYLENKYNEIKQILENNQNDTIQSEE
ncbi:hypothetical protein J6G99_03510 [bacterium]|nr:hypothetical protein [bacterium]